MHPELDLVSALQAHLPAFTPKHVVDLCGDRYTTHRVAALGSLVTLAHAGNVRRHSVESDAISYTARFLRQRLRMGSGTGYQALVEIAFEFEAGNSGYSKDRHVTKAYRPRTAITALLDKILDQSERHPLVWWCDGAIVPAPKEFPEEGMPASMGGIMSVPSVISLDLQHLSDSLSKINLALRSRSSEAPLNESKPFGTTLGQARSSLLTAIAYTRALGGVPNFYGDPQSGGRVGPLGFHLIQMPSDLRHMMLDGSGLIDLDLEGCFPSIFLSLGRHLGFVTDLTEAYLHNKTDCHEQWRDVSGHHAAKDFKGLILSFFTGGRLSGWHETASGAVFGKEVMAALRQDRGLKALYNEIHNGMSTVLQHQERHTYGAEHILVNAIGCELSVASPGAAFGAQCSHVLTGLEQFAIQSICDRMVGLKAVIYDGMVATPQDCEALEAIIRSESDRLLGFPLALRLKETTFVSPMRSWPTGGATLQLVGSSSPQPHVNAQAKVDLSRSAAA